MKVNISVDLETTTGEFEIKFSSENGEQMDRTDLVNLLRKVVEQWNLKFVD